MRAVKNVYYRDGVRSCTQGMKILYVLELLFSLGEKKLKIFVFPPEDIINK